MAVKGAQLKSEITQKILAAFPGSFLYNDGKEIRIDGMEAGERIQIKVTLTASKTPVDSDGSVPAVSASEKIEFTDTSSVDKSPNEPTEEEKERLKRLLEGLGL